MIGRFRILMIFAVLSSWPLALMAQSLGAGAAASDGLGAPSINTFDPYRLLQKRWIVSGKVMTLDGNPVAGVRSHRSTYRLGRSPGSHHQPSGGVRYRIRLERGPGKRVQRGRDHE